MNVAFGVSPSVSISWPDCFLPSGFPFSVSVLGLKDLVALNTLSLQYFPVSCSSYMDVDCCFIDLVLALKNFDIIFSYLLIMGITLYFKPENFAVVK